MSRLRPLNPLLNKSRMFQTVKKQEAMDRALLRSVEIVQRCYGCKRYIVADDDDAFVCTECGGQNRLAVVSV